MKTFNRISSPAPSQSLFHFMDGLIFKMEQSGRISTANNYRSAKHSLQNFCNATDLPLSSLDRLMIEDYQVWLKRRGLMRNSISFYMRVLRAVYNRGVLQGLTTDRRPFVHVFTGVERTRKRAISFEDIKRLQALDLQADPPLEMARDIFLFLFCCRGMSFIDAAYIKKTDIRDGMLIYRRHKTGQQLQIRIVDKIGSLIKRLTIPDSPYLLPVITAAGINERRQYETGLRMINKSLKRIGEMIDLPIPLTTYVSRHSWANIAKSKGVRVGVISEALGHDCLKTTLIYLDSIGTDIIDLANDTVIDGL